MTGKQLRSALKKFFGDKGYQEMTAIALKVNPATVYRWLAEDEIPGPVEAWAQERMKRRA